MLESDELDEPPVPGDAPAPLTSRQRFAKIMVAGVPLLIIVFFFTYLWWVSGVLPYVERFPNQKPAVLGYMKRNGTSYERTGRWVMNHPNGQKASEGFYEHGSKVTGTWHYWDESGAELPGEPPAETQPSTGD